MLSRRVRAFSSGHALLSRYNFESTRANLSVADSSDAVQVVFSTAAVGVAQLLVAAIFANVHSCQKPVARPYPRSAKKEPAARILPSRIADRTLSGDLTILYSRVDSSQLSVALAVPLVEQVLSSEPGSTSWSDVEFWSVVFDLVSWIKTATPPATFETAVFDTPLRSSSASQKGIEQTHDEVDQRILKELTGRVYYDVGGFYERYFEGKVWTNNARDVYEESRAQYAEGRWSGWPEPSLQGPFFEWFMKFQDTFLSRLRRRYYTSASKVLRGLGADRKLDIFLTPADAAFQDGEHDWSNVLVIGEHKRNPDEDRLIATLVQ